MTKETAQTNTLVKETAQDIGSLLAVAQAGVLLELPSVQSELKRFRGRLKRRLDSGALDFSRDLQAVYREAIEQVSILLDSSDPSGYGETQATAQTQQKLRRDWLAGEQRAGRLTGDKERALEHLIETWQKVRKSLAVASVPYERVFRQRTRREALLPLERLAERGDQSVLECWLPWARQWQSTPARRSNSKKSVDVLEVVEPIVLLGWHPQRADKEFALLVGSAEIWLDKVLKDYARRLDIFVDKQQGF